MIFGPWHFLSSIIIGNKQNFHLSHTLSVTLIQLQALFSHIISVTLQQLQACFSYAQLILCSCIHYSHLSQQLSCSCQHFSVILIQLLSSCCEHSSHTPSVNFMQFQKLFSHTLCNSHVAASTFPLKWKQYIYFEHF